MLLLSNPVRDYAWGPVDGLARLLGSTPTGGPEAELWVGSHPAAPSTVVEGAGAGDGSTLDALIASDPARWLGPELAAKGYDALPFLLKVLAIGAPLSLQAHPSAEQAEAGYAREDRAGLALDDPRRTFRDRGAKPEALVALCETWALCGFRPADEAAELVEALSIEGLDPLVELLRGPDALHRSFEWLLGRGEDSPLLASHLAEVIPPDAAATLDPSDAGSAATARAWVARVQAAFPNDVLAVAPLVLQVVRLDRGDAVHLPAGNLHAYLEGAGVEVMSASDNVLRGGLTPKHIDVDELLASLRFEPGVPPPPEVTEVAAGVLRFDAGEAAFGLSSVTPGDDVTTIDPTGPSLFLATDGPVDLAGGDGGVVLEGGSAAFVPPGAGPLEVSGPGTLWWATTGEALPG
jgi:mannose-6-phosphate isomerase